MIKLTILSMILATLMSVTAEARSADACESIFVFSSPTRWRTLKKLESTWSSRQPLMVKTSEGDLPLTFSFDSEVSNVEWLPLIIAHPPALQVLEAKLQETHKRTSFSIEELGEALGVSPKQALAFDVKKGATPTSEDGRYALRDLSNRAIDALFPKHDRDMLPDWFEYHMQEIVRSERYGLDVKTSVDMLNLEFAHSSYETIPAKYAEQIDRLHSLFPKAQTHLHIAVPAAIGQDATIEIARALEAKIVLNMLRDYHISGGALPYKDGTSLSRKRVAARGPVYLKLSEWYKPHHSHDIEIRQWPTITAGMGMVSMAADLAQNHVSLKTVELLEYNLATRDPRFGNVLGALEYAFEMFSRSQNPQHIAITKALREFHRRVYEITNQTGASHVPVELRREISNFIRKYEVDRLLTADLVLGR